KANRSVLSPLARPTRARLNRRPQVGGIGHARNPAAELRPDRDPSDWAGRSRSPSHPRTPWLPKYILSEKAPTELLPHSARGIGRSLVRPARLLATIDPPATSLGSGGANRVRPNAGLFKRKIFIRAGASSASPPPGPRTLGLKCPPCDRAASQRASLSTGKFG